MFQLSLVTVKFIAQKRFNISLKVLSTSNTSVYFTKYTEGASFWCRSCHNSIIWHEDMGSKNVACFHVSKSCQLSELCNSKTNPHKCSSLESAVILLLSNTSLSFIAHCILELQLLKILPCRSCLSCSWFSSLLLQVYDSKHHIHNWARN